MVRCGAITAASLLSNPDEEIAEPIMNPAIINQTAVEPKPANNKLGSINCNVMANAKKIKPVKKGGSNDALQQVSVIKMTAAL